VSENVTYCIAGDVDANALVFSNGTDTLATQIVIVDNNSETTPLGSIRVLLIKNGIIPVASTENTYQDNQ
jgi:hypothetical protein